MVLTKTIPALPIFSQPGSLLRTKIVTPKARAKTVKRERLLQILDQGLAGKLTLLSAPAGSGKTTLLVEWISSSPTPTAWFSVDPGDNDPSRFLTYLLGTLESFHQSSNLSSPPMLPTLQSGSFETVLTHLINQLADIPSPCVLILDDYQFIKSQTVHEIMSYLLDHVPDNLHLVIATREDPPLPLAKLRVRGQLTEIRNQDLRFTGEETTEFFKVAMGEDLMDADVAVIESSTEGWAAGLQMAGLMVREKAKPAEVIRSFSGKQRHVMEYLTEEVLIHQPERVRSFLVQSSILERMCSSLCDAVFHDSIFSTNEAQETSSQAMLEYCERSNLFLFPLDEEHGWYRYQNLFVDLLRTHLNQIPVERIKVLYLRAAGWCELHQYFEEAVKYAVAAGDFEFAASILEKNVDALLMRIELSALLNLVVLFPMEWIYKRPWLGICKAWAISYSAKNENVEELLINAKKNLSRAETVEDKRQMEGYIAAIRARVAEMKGETTLAVEQSQLALEKLPDRTALRSVVTFFLGEAAFFAGDLKSARKYLSDVIENGKKSGNISLAISALCRLAKVCKFEGRLHQAERLYKDANDLLNEQRADHLSFTSGTIEVGLADLYREWNRLKDARKILAPVTSQPWMIHNPNVLVFGLTSEAWLDCIEGNLHNAGELLKKSQKIAILHNLFFDIHSHLEGVQALTWLLEGDLQQAVEWADVKEAKLEVSNLSAFSAGLELITLARVRMAQGKFDKTQMALSDLAEKAELGGQTGSLIEIILLLALVWQAQGKTSQALQMVKKAVELGEPEGFRRIYLDKGQPMAALLKLGLKRGIWPKPDYASQLLEALDKELNSKQSLVDQTNHFVEKIVPGLMAKTLVEPLTLRELEILRLLADGYSNREMAAELVLSVGTVKAHVHHIFQKLEVEGRVRAIQKAKEMNLL